MAKKAALSVKSMTMTWTNARGLLRGRTSRASLHASCLQIIFIIGLILKVKLQCSKFKVKFPTCNPDHIAR